MKTLDLFFSDLSDEAKKEVLDFLGISSPAEANLDLDILPLTTLELHEETDEADEG